MPIKIGRFEKAMNAVMWVTICVLLLVAVAGCSFVKPSDRVVIDQHYSNAKAINAFVQKDPSIPDWVKQWWDGEVETWKCMSDWSHGRTPSPTSQPAE